MTSRSQQKRKMGLFLIRLSILKSLTRRSFQSDRRKDSRVKETPSLAFSKSSNLFRFTAPSNRCTSRAPRSHVALSQSILTLKFQRSARNAQATEIKMNRLKTQLKDKSLLATEYSSKFYKSIKIVCLKKERHPRHQPAQCCTSRSSRFSTV